MKKASLFLLFFVSLFIFSMANTKIPVFPQVSQPTLKTQFLNKDILILQQNTNKLLIIKDGKINLIDISKLNISFIDYILYSNKYIVISATPDKDSLDNLKIKYKKIITNMLFIIDYKGNIIMKIPSLMYADTTKAISISGNNKYILWIRDNYVSTKITFIDLENKLFYNLNNKEIKERKFSNSYIISNKKKLLYNNKTIMMLSADNSILWRYSLEKQIINVDFIREFRQILITTENKLILLNNEGSKLFSISNIEIIPRIYGFFSKSYIFDTNKIITRFNDNIYLIKIKGKDFKIRKIAKKSELLDLYKSKALILIKKDKTIILKNFAKNKILYSIKNNNENIKGRICRNKKCIILIEGILGFNGQIDILQY